MSFPVPSFPVRAVVLDWAGTTVDFGCMAPVRALIEVFGAEAGFEAQARADRSRDLGNHLHFCRWRQIERLILLLGADHALGAVQ